MINARSELEGLFRERKMPEQRINVLREMVMNIEKNTANSKAANVPMVAKRALKYAEKELSKIDRVAFTTLDHIRSVRGIFGWVRKRDSLKSELERAKTWTEIVQDTMDEM